MHIAHDPVHIAAHLRIGHCKECVGTVTDAGVGALAARSAVLGACLNVKINAAGLKDRAVADDLIGQANRIVADAEKAEREILEIVESKIK